MPILSNKVQCVLCQSPCGETRMFNSKKLTDTWVRLHKKKCEICSEAGHTVAMERDIYYPPFKQNTMKVDIYKELDEVNQSIKRN